MTSSAVPFIQVATPIASLILTAAIAIITLRIQHQQAEIQRQQAETNRNQLRLHLFDRRWVVYDAVMTFTEDVASKAEVTGEDLWKFAIATKSARFLFNQEIQDYCDKLRKEAVAINVGKWMMDDMKSQRTEEQHRQSVQAWGDRMEWFTGQRDKIQERFAPFLQIAG